jgi:hypothetical protein
MFVEHRVDESYGTLANCNALIVDAVDLQIVSIPYTLFS